MRSLIAVVLVVLTRVSNACPPPDHTYVLGPGGRLDADTPTITPRNPTVYVHVAGANPSGLPSFTRPDGSVVPSRARESIYMNGKDAVRVDLSVESGDVIVKVPATTFVALLPGAALLPEGEGAVWATSEEIIGTLRVSDTFVPAAVSIARRSTMLELDSNATLYRIERFDGTREYDVRFAFVPGDEGLRIVAVYADRSEKQVYVRWPRSLSTTRVLWLIALACSAWLGARFARGFGHARS